MNGIDKVRLALEARNPGYVVVQMTDLRGLPDDVADGLMVAVVNAPPPLTHYDQLTDREGK